MTIRNKTITETYVASLEIALIGYINQILNDTSSAWISGELRSNMTIRKNIITEQYVANLESVLVEYINRYGLTDSARAVLSTEFSEETADDRAGPFRPEDTGSFERTVSSLLEHN